MKYFQIKKIKKRYVLAFLIIVLACVILALYAYLLLLESVFGGDLNILVVYGALSALASIIVVVVPIWALKRRNVIASLLVVSSVMLMVVGIDLS